MIARCRGLLLLALSLLVTGLGDRAAGAQHVDEYRLKAAVLFNLSKFVDWPENAFADPTAPMVFCVLGVDPFKAALDDVLRGHTVGQHPAVPKRVADAATGCHALFVANSEIRRLASVTDQLAGRPVLSVSELPGFARQGGMIGLVIENDRVQFEINPDSVEAAHLRISSNLLALASSVIRR